MSLLRVSSHNRAWYMLPLDKFQLFLLNCIVKTGDASMESKITIRGLMTQYNIYTHTDTMYTLV